MPAFFEKKQMAPPFHVPAPTFGYLCVSTPVPKGLRSTNAGDGDTCIASPSTKLAIHGEDISSGRGADVPAFNTPTPMVHPAAVSLVPWLFS